MLSSIRATSRAGRPLLSSRPRAAIPTLRPLSSTATTRSSDHHESPYEPPGGWLWGIPPGEKPAKERWEPIWFYGFGGCMLFLVVGYMYKPDTSIQTWALEEARRRLEAEGILEDPDAKKS